MNIKVILIIACVILVSLFALSNALNIYENGNITLEEHDHDHNHDHDEAEQNHDEDHVHENEMTDTHTHEESDENHESSENVGNHSD
jgi:ABC-type nickel/cobalt efflux system permease component RcnA